jgi:3-methylcrotonyl-CoA carboxylase alpha subunit
MGESAVDAARAVGYVGAGTVEFIMDNDDQSYYFMEMNTRLQVEHPVTEMITGQDLVEWQIRVASGHTLPLLQPELKVHGHSFETRIYAENPDNNFLPGTGTLQYLKAPQEIPGQVRVETGVRQGDEVSIYYDPMIAKLVVWAEDRDKALKRLRANLEQYHIAGLVTNIEFLKKLCTNKHFRELDLDTHFIQRHYAELFPEDGGKTQEDRELGNVLGAVGLVARSTLSGRSGDPFTDLRGTRLNHQLTETIELKEPKGDGKVTVDVTFKSSDSGDRFSIKTSSQPNRVRDISVVPSPTERNAFTVYVDDEKHFVTYVANDKDVEDHALHLFTQRGDVYKVEPIVPSVGHVSEAGTGSLKSPMPGAIMAVNVKQGDQVKKGQTLLVMESMKMELKIASPADGIVQSVTCREGDSVGGGQVLAVVVPNN